MESIEPAKRYIITREPIGSANKHLTDQTTLILNLQTDIKQIQTWIQILADQITGVDRKTDGVYGKLDGVFGKMDDVSEKMDGVCGRMDGISQKINGVSEEITNSVKALKNQQFKLSSQIKTGSSVQLITTCTQTPKTIQTSSAESVKLCKTAKPELSQEGGPTVLMNTPGTRVTGSSQVVTLNAESDFPHGSWLGNPEDVHRRVRVPISSEDLYNLEQSQPGAEKLALALLDRLFSRTTLAESNLTGKGRHKKKQLNPLFIYGIYSHLKYQYSISELDWNRLKNNIEARCRFLFKRKLKKLPLGEPKPIEPASAENCSIVVYPLYQVDSSHLMQVGLEGLDHHVLQQGSDSLELQQVPGEMEHIQPNPTRIDPDSTQHLEEIDNSGGDRFEEIETSGEGLEDKPEDLEAVRDGELDHLEPVAVLEVEATEEDKDKDIVEDGVQGTPELGQETLTLTSSGELIMTDLGSVICIPEQEEEDCMMVSSVHYM
ncbi:protein BANP [Eurytemora carolleeae]|uniref:protein BANP n=1 Tax=Eurytemora carolleeae TaxID=1294199 RepID=UPI000C77564E|nr:protein BANP [Eurytemora carolleeae]|eukprot:XP_023338977.1 protein BANP-like [Eurytemora affinis]